MKLKLLGASALLMLCACNFAAAQSKPTRDVKMPTERHEGIVVKDYVEYDRGFFMSGELSGAWSLNSGRDNLGLVELDATAGYRFSDFFRAGIGIGARRYIDSDHVRYMSHDWGMPLFVNIRGNFVPTDYRTVVPFWSVDVGTTFPDGVMVRPTVGIRVGEKRSAFVASVGYLGQDIRTLPVNDKKRTFYSFITLKLGYEF